MPWLVGTALIYSLAVTEKRGTFKNGTVLLAIMTFSLSLLAAFFSHFLYLLIYDINFIMQSLRQPWLSL
jgi:cytochrome c biogenesis factor